MQGDGAGTIGATQPQCLVTTRHCYSEHIFRQVLRVGQTAEPSHKRQGGPGTASNQHTSRHAQIGLLLQPRCKLQFELRSRRQLSPSTTHQRAVHCNRPKHQEQPRSVLVLGASAVRRHSAHIPTTCPCCSCCPVRPVSSITQAWNDVALLIHLGINDSCVHLETCRGGRRDRSQEHCQKGPSLDFL